METTQAADTPSGDVTETRGFGGHMRVEASGLSATRDARLTGLAIRRGWTGAKRWDTDSTIEDIQRLAAEGGTLTAKQKALLAVHRDLMSAEERARQIAVRNLVSMEAQNQADDHKEIPDLSVNVNATVDATDRRGRLAAIVASAKARIAGEEPVVEQPAAPPDGNGHADSNGHR